MLGKLTKYEIKATARTFLPLYAGLLLFALINKIFIEINLLQTKLAFLSTISVMIYFFIIVATFIITLVVMIQRFYKNLLSDEGYLMFTLPVTPGKHIISKMIVSILWAVVSVIAAVLSVLVLGYQKEMFGNIRTLIVGFFKLPLERSSPILLTGGLFLLAILAALTVFVLQIYASLALGHLASKYRVLLSFVAYLVIGMIWQALASVGIIILGSIHPLLNWVNGLQSIHQMQLFMAGILLVSLVQSIILYLITNVILSKKLNLE